MSVPWCREMERRVERLKEVCREEESATALNNPKKVFKYNRYNKILNTFVLVAAKDYRSGVPERSSLLI
jgi:hypothetical protein